MLILPSSALEKTFLPLVQIGKWVARFTGPMWHFMYLPRAIGQTLLEVLVLINTIIINTGIIKVLMISIPKEQDAPAP